MKHHSVLHNPAYLLHFMCVWERPASVSCVNKMRAGKRWKSSELVLYTHRPLSVKTGTLRNPNVCGCAVFDGVNNKPIKVRQPKQRHNNILTHIPTHYGILYGNRRDRYTLWCLNMQWPTLQRTFRIIRT